MQHYLFFFFQAEDGIRDKLVTGVQTCALPILITVGATILALFPLALEGGPLWQPLCYAQIGGLAVATFITLLLVPVFYAIFVLDLKWITWEVAHPSGDKVERKADSPLLGSVSS